MLLFFSLFLLQAGHTLHQSHTNHSSHSLAHSLPHQLLYLLLLCSLVESWARNRAAHATLSKHHYCNAVLALTLLAQMHPLHLTLPILSLLSLSSPSPVHSQATKTPGASSSTASEGVIPLIYNDYYQPEILDLLTQGVLKYGLFKSELRSHTKLKSRVDTASKGLNLDLGVGLLGNTVKVDLGLGLGLKSKKARLARHEQNRSSSSSSSSTHHQRSHKHAKRLLGLELNLGALLGGGTGDDATSSSLVNVDLGIQTIVDDPWNDAITTRLMNSQNDNAVSRLCFGLSHKQPHRPHANLLPHPTCSGSLISPSVLHDKPSPCLSIPDQQTQQSFHPHAPHVVSVLVLPSFTLHLQHSPIQTQHSTLNTVMERQCLVS